MASSNSDVSARVHDVHVVLVPYPAQGHINPLLQFGKRLATHHSGAVRCTLAVPRSALSSSGPSPSPSSSSSTAPPPPVVPVVAISDGCDLGGYDEVGDVHEYLARLESAGSRTLDELLGSSSHGGGGRTVVVVYDAFLRWVPRVARRHGAACAAYFTQACSVNVVYEHAWRGRVKVPVEEVVLDPEGLLPGLPRGLRLEPADCSTFLTKKHHSSDDYLEMLLEQCQGLQDADHVLVNSFYELQTEEAEYMASRWGARTVGPTVPSAYLDNRVPNDSSYSFSLHVPMATECKTWLANKPAHSVVYVSFGSIATPGPEQLAEMAQGLCNSGKAFLWVVRSSETSKLLESIASKVKERGLIVAWSPQLEVLSHEAVGCFVTHCGWNSTMEGLGIGVPMVAMPQWADQPMNAKYIEDVWRVGVRARPNVEGIVRKDEVERCVREVMDGVNSKEYMKNAMDWKEKAKRAISEGGSSDRNIIEFLAKFGLN